MRREEFERLLRHADMAVPEGVGLYLEDIELREGDRLMSDAFLQECASRGGLDKSQLESLAQALETIEEDRQLLQLSLALRDDVQRALILQRAYEFERPVPSCLEGFAKDAYSLLFALACLEQGLIKLQARGIPKEQYENVCWNMAVKQLKHFAETNDVVIDNYSWDMNFYGCGIFLMDRFYFIPFRWGEPPIYRRKSDGRVLALWPEGQMVRRDGQLNGVNGIHDKDAFTTTWLEDEQTITAYPVNPVGVIRQNTQTISKDEWIAALMQDDMCLAAHIPGGAGYTPERWKHSMIMARSFFDKWFPEIRTKGFWSESWLYDPSLYRLLPPEGHIMSVQQQFYNFPTMEGENMAKLEVFGAEDADLDKAVIETSLQRKMLDSLKKGEHYHCTGMFVLYEELSRFGQRPYQSEQDISDYLNS